MELENKEPMNGNLPGIGLSARRENIRRSFLRANTAVAVVLIAVLTLASAAVVASLRAARLQRRAEQAQDSARMELRDAYISKARAARLGSALGRRRESLEAIAQAAKIRPSIELRDAAIAALALPDFLVERSWPLPTNNATLAFDHLLQHYASGLENGDVLIHGTSDNQVLKHLRPTDAAVPAGQGGISGLEFSPDGKWLAIRFQRSGIIVWEWGTDKVVFRHALDRPRQPLSRPRFTSDGRHLVCMTSVPVDGVAVFDLTSGERIAHLPQFKSYFHAAPRPGTTMFSINTETNAAVLVDWRSGSTVAAFPFPAAIQRMAWNSDGTRLAIAGSTVDVHLWDLETGQKRILTGHTTEIRHLAFSPDGEWLASSAWDGTSRIWETRTGRLVGYVDGFVDQFGDDGRLALNRFKNVVEIGAIRSSPVYGAPAGPGPAEAPTWAMDMSADGRWLATLIHDKRLVIWDLTRKTKPVSFEAPGVRLPAFHPERPELFLTTRRGITMQTLTNNSTNDAATLRRSEPASIPMPSGFNPQWIALSGDGRTTAFGSFFDGKVFVADRATPERRIWLNGLGHLTRLEAESPSASTTGGGTLALSRDGRRAVCGFVYPHGVKVWDTQSGEIVATLASENAVIQFSPEGGRIAAGSRSSYRMIATNGWREIWNVPREGSMFGPGPCAFSPDGAQLAVTIAPQLTAILDAETGREIARLAAPRPATIKALRWAPDGRRLVAGTMENFIQVWELTALNRELAALGIAWPGSGAPSMDARVADATLSEKSVHRPEITWALALGLLAAGAVTMVALFALRRHRCLIEEFAASEDRAGQRERELQVEREVGRLKSHFVATVSHEFRTPLGITMSAVELLRNYLDRLPSAKLRELLDDIYSSTLRMSGLMEQVLLLGRVEAGKLGIDFAPLDVAAFGHKLVDEMLSATNRKCPVQFQATADLDNASGDEALLRHIFSNLLSNAVKYSSQGDPVEFNVQRAGTDALFIVRDRGIGIPESDQAHLFEAFHRAANVSQIPGTGLGLLIVKRCVELHGGTIAFESRVGTGTTFTVRVPLFFNA